MRKRMMTLAAVAVLTITLTACGAAQTSNNPTPTVEPTKEVEATTAPTVEPTKEAEVTTAPTAEPTATNVPEPTATSTPIPEPTTTPEPTSTPTPEPTATPEPTSTPTPEPTATPVPTSTPTPEPTATPVPTSTPTPEPTTTPVPTEAPKADTKDWKTVLRELHSLETYAEREAYVAKLDKSAYKVEKTENFDLINKNNYGETEISRAGAELYKLISDDTGETVAEYTDDTLDSLSDDGYYDYAFMSMSFDHHEYGLCHFETSYTYETITVNAEPAFNSYVEEYCAYYCMEGNYKPVSLMTLTNIATGETDPWGVVAGGIYYDWTVDANVPQQYTIERMVRNYNEELAFQATDSLECSMSFFYGYAHGEVPLHPIETWDTLKYYEDLVDFR